MTKVIACLAAAGKCYESSQRAANELGKKGREAGSRCYRATVASLAEWTHNDDPGITASASGAMIRKRTGDSTSSGKTLSAMIQPLIAAEEGFAQHG